MNTQSTRSRAIIIKDKQLLLLHRIKDGKHYFVFPGGGREKDETAESCVIRECYEELGVTVKVNELKYTVVENDVIQDYFYCTIESGVVGTGKGLEFTDNKKGKYIPVFKELKALPDLSLVPKKLKNVFMQDITAYNEIKNIPYRKL